MPNLGPTELIIILLIVILLFGAKKIPEIAKGLGKGIRDFKTSMKDEEHGENKTADKLPGAAEDRENRPSA
jgi:sec-independent protein translocase protein TatA